MSKVLRIEDKEVFFKQVNFFGDDVYYAPFAFGFHNNREELDNPDDIRSKMYDVYFDSITDVAEFGYVLQNVNDNTVMYMGGDPIYKVINHKEIQDSVDMYPFGEYGEDAYLAIMGERFTVLGTLIGGSLPSSVGISDSGKPGLGLILDADTVKEFFNAKMVTKSEVVNSVVDNLKVKRDNINFIIDMLSFASKEFSGTVTPSDILGTIKNVVNNPFGRESTSDEESEISKQIIDIAERLFSEKSSPDDFTEE